MVTGVLVVTALVVIEKLALLWVVVTVTDAGTVASALLELSLTTIPAVGAMPVRVTVPPVLVPPTTEDKVNARLDSVGGVTTKVVDFVELPIVATIVTVVDPATGLVPIVNVVELWPDGTTTVAGTVTAAVLLEVKLTVSPEGPA
jgi:hypothetical protein